MNGINHCFPLSQCLGQAKKYIHMKYCKISAVDKCVHLILREGDISSLGTKTQNFRYIFGVLRWGPSFFSRQHQKVELLNWSTNHPKSGVDFFQQKWGFQLWKSLPFVRTDCLAGFPRFAPGVGPDPTILRSTPDPARRVAGWEDDDFPAFPKGGTC